MRPLLTSLARMPGRRGVALAAVVLAVLAVSPAASSRELPPPCAPTDFDLAVTLRLVGSAQVGSNVKIVAENPRFIRERRNCTLETKPVPTFDWVLVTKPAGSQAALVKNGLETTLPLDRPGPFVVRYLACPSSCTIVSGTTPVVVPPQWTDLTVNPGSADLWVMGIEVNQGVTDEVFRTVGTTPLVVPRNSSRRPLIAGKPAVVRVYIGVRNNPNYPVQPATATGTLRVTVGGSSRLFVPVSGPTATCRQRIGGAFEVRPDPCHSAIAVPPSLARAGLPAGATTPSLNDLDLVSRRTTWSGTLNFIVPASLLADARRVLFEAAVAPIGVAERSPGDNAMVLDHRRIARGPHGIVRPVLVSFRDPATGTLHPAPPAAAATNALRQSLRLTSFARLSTDGSWRVMTYAGETTKVLGRRLNQCETLWWRLYQRYGLNRHRPLVAFLPEEASFSCGGRNPSGLGFRVPHIPLLLEGGGISWAKTPRDPAEIDIDRFVPVAHELYHGLDARHISNDHGEGGGCASLNRVLRLVLGIVFDTTCWQNGDGPHGTIGVYPKRTAVGSLQSYDGAKGAMGVDHLATGAGAQLTLYDPCPTSIVATNALASVLLRFNPTCPVGDDNRAHDFMSYGPNPWASPRQFFGRVGLPLMPPP